MATARYLARAQLIAAGVALLIGVVGGVAMQLELLAPGPLWTAERYGWMLGLHAVGTVAIGASSLAALAGYHAVARLVGAARLPWPVLAWVGFGAWAIGLACVLGAALLPPADTGWTLYAPDAVGGDSTRPLVVVIGPLALAASSVIYAFHLGIVIAKARPAPLAAALAAVLVVVLAGAGIAAGADAFAAAPGGVAAKLGTGFALMLATIALAGDAPAHRALVAVGMGLAIAWGALPMLVIALGLAGIWIALAITGGFGRPVVACVVFGCAPALMLHGIAGIYASGEDVFLHDTHFVVGTLHLVAAALGFAALAALHAWAGARAPNRLAVWIGVGLASSGVVFHAWASLRVGARGMPRRYWDYDPELTGGHALVAAGAALAIAGGVVLILAWLVGRPRSRG